MQTSEAKFANSVDKLAPVLLELICPAENIIYRFKTQLGKEKQEIVPMIDKKKSPYMEWDSFLSQFHAELLQQLEIKLNS